MKQKTSVLFLFCLLLAFSLQAQGQTQIIAHRGYWQTEGSAQNSIRALELADEIRVYGSEFDVHLTADNVAVIFHDDTIQGIAIQSATYDEIKDLTLANGEKLPTLQEYLEKGKTLTHTRLIFELKPHQTPERNQEAARTVVEIVDRMGLKDRTEYITFDMDAGKEFIRVAPEAAVAYLRGDVAPAELKALGYTGLDYHYNVMLEHPEWFEEAREAGLTINVWTVNDPEIIRQMVMSGVDYITTDIPEEAAAIAAHPVTTIENI
ncbi:MAG: glycerophosphodiester phosphodiesterase [Tannerellaceae bacterium]|nr:glycerophosphodiester phosphodiesterase [Tannerellaceae bacterium]